MPFVSKGNESLEQYEDNKSGLNGNCPVPPPYCGEDYYDKYLDKNISSEVSVTLGVDLSEKDLFRVDL